MATPTTDGGSITHCEWCGAEYDQPRTAPPAHPHRPPRPSATEAEPATHCEWCGAEYPVPRGDAERRDASS